MCSSVLVLLAALALGLHHGALAPPHGLAWCTCCACGHCRAERDCSGGSRTVNLVRRKGGAHRSTGAREWVAGTELETRTPQCFAHLWRGCGNRACRAVCCALQDLGSVAGECDARECSSSVEVWDGQRRWFMLFQQKA